MPDYRTDDAPLDVYRLSRRKVVFVDGHLAEDTPVFEDETPDIGIDVHLGTARRAVEQILV